MEKQWLLKTKIYFGSVLGDKVGEQDKRLSIAWLIHKPFMNNLSWHVHENTNVLTEHPKESQNALSPPGSALKQGKRHNLSPHLHPCLHSASFSKSTLGEWNWTWEGGCSAARRRNSKWASGPAFKLSAGSVDTGCRSVDQMDSHVYTSAFMSAASWKGHLCGWDVFLYSWLH